MQIEDVAGVCLTARASAEEQREGTVGNRVFREIVIDNQHVFSLMHEILCQRGCGVRRDILHRCRVCRGGNHDGRIAHGVMFLQGIHETGNGRSLLADRHIDADAALSLLIQDRVKCDRGFSGLTVADDQLTLAAADRKHRIDGENAGLQGHTDGFSVHNAGGRFLDRAVIARLNRIASVDRCAERIDHAPDIILADGNAGALAGCRHTGTLTDRALLIEEDGADAVIGNVLDHAADAVFEDDDLAVLRVIQSADPDDAVSGRLHEADFTFLRSQLKICDRPFQDGHDIIAAVIFRRILPRRVNLAFKLTGASAGRPVVFGGSDLKNEAAVDGRIDLRLQFNLIGAVFFL